MAIVYTDLPAVKFGLIDEANPNTHYTITAGQSYPVGGYKNTANRSAFLIGFDDFPAALKRNKLIGGLVTAYAPKVVQDGAEVSGYWSSSVGMMIADDFDASTITFNSYPAYSDAYSSAYDFFSFSYTSYDGDKREATAPSYSDIESGGTEDFHKRKREIIRKRTIRLATYSSAAKQKFTYIGTKLQNGSSAPFLRVYYDDADVATSYVYRISGPSGGSYSDPTNTTRFAWGLSSTIAASMVYDADFAQASATFKWKAGSGSWTSVSISGDVKELTVAANTFPAASTITWYVEATDEDGTTTQTEEFTFSTADGAIYAAPVSPVSATEAGDKSISFAWSIASDTGSTATRTELQYSEDSGSTWTTLLDTNEERRSFVAPANTFSGGTINWRVRAYNRDGVAGDWGTASFVVIGAPGAPENLIADEVPFLTLTWQSSGQQAYEVFVDGVSQGAKFGTAKSWTSGEPLTDGEHVIAVSVQGVYGLWSTPAEIPVTIANTPGDAVELIGSFDIDADLQWVTASTAADILIYRDGVRIGHTVQSFFEDSRCLGEHEWFVLNRLPDGNYTKSNSVTGTLQTEATMIAAFGSGDWIELKLTEQRNTAQRYDYARTHSLRHVSGAAFPVLEISPYEDETASFDTAFLSDEDLRRFEDLRGRVVMIKARGGQLIVGALTNLQKTVGDFYTVCTFSVQRIHWEDFVDDALY